MIDIIPGTWRKQNARCYKSDNGEMLVAEEGFELPFVVQRSYILMNVPQGGVRGNHAHKRLKQFYILLAGSVSLDLENSTERTMSKLSKAGDGLIVSGLVWRQFHNFSSDAIVLALCSDLFDEDDYIRDYQDFVAYTSFDTA